MPAFQGAPLHPNCTLTGDSPAEGPVFSAWLTATHLIKPAAPELQLMKEPEAASAAPLLQGLCYIRSQGGMIMAGAWIKIVGVGVLKAVPGDGISLYEYRKIHQTEIIKWSRWGSCAAAARSAWRCCVLAGPAAWLGHGMASYRPSLRQPVWNKDRVPPTGLLLPQGCLAPTKMQKLICLLGLPVTPRCRSTFSHPNTAVPPAI